MNDHRSELAGLRRELERLETELRFAKVRADQLEQRIAYTELQNTLGQAWAALHFAFPQEH